VRSADRRALNRALARGADRRTALRQFHELGGKLDAGERRTAGLPDAPKPERPIMVLPPGIKAMRVDGRVELDTDGMNRATAAFERIGDGLAAVSDAAQKAAAAFDLEQQSISANAMYVGGDAAVTDVAVPDVLDHGSES
jgi:hypothetical protein